MASKAVTSSTDRVAERRRAVALARHFREAEGLSIGQIAERLGRSPATVKAYFYEPTGEKARAVKARYQGVCRGCGAYTQPRNGKGDAYAYCKACHPGATERPVDAGTRGRRDARMAQPLWPAAIVVRLVAHTRARAWRRAARATQHRRLAFGRRRDRRLRELEGGTGCGRNSRSSRLAMTIDGRGASFLTTNGRPAGGHRRSP